MKDMEKELHEHHDDDECGCDCGCGHHHHHDEEEHEHEHHHHHDDDDECECGCGHHHHDHEHEHHDEDECGCGHQHDHHHHDDEECECGCGHHHHEHEHHHHDDDECGCGCGHHHHHDDDDECGCGCGHHHDHGEHDHHHHEAVEHETYIMPAGVGQKTYIVENLGCANCAAKMERKIQALPEVEGATLTYATKKLVVASDHQENLLPKLQEICSSIESEVQVVAMPDNQPVKREKTNPFEENKKDIILVGAGAVLFAAGVIAEKVLPNPMISACIFIIAYLLLGLEIVMKALKNMAGGHLFDENFLMAVATIAAFAIGDFAEAVGVMLFYRIGELFEDIAVEKSRGQIMDAVDMRPEVVNLVNGSDVKEIPAGDAKVKDIIMIRPGDRIPLDAKVVEGESRVDTSPVTGEPVPVRVVPGDELISGCINEQGVLKAEVTKPLSESMVTKILDSVENAAASKPKIDRFITRFARVYTPVVVLAAVLTAIIPSLVTGDWNHWIYTAITFLVISCPCALVLSVPLAFFSGIGAGSKRGILFKGGVAIEALKDVKAVVMDKTGTITKGNFAVQKVTATRKLTEKQVLTMAADCELGSTHPIAVSIVQEAKRQNLTLTRPKEVEEISGKGIRAVFPEGIVLLGNYALMEMYQVDTTGYEKGGYGSEVLLAVDGVLEGFVIVADEIKPDAIGSVSKMKSLGIATVMLTGDEKNSAQAVAKETGIDEVYAQLLPQQKLEHLQDVRKNHGAVMFVGDGINDAPVLAGADVGAAMGSGADAAIEAADVVFMNSSVEAIPQSIAIAKKTGSIAIQNVVFALVIKAIVMILGFLGYANMWLAVFADTGVAMLCVLNSIRAMYVKFK